MANQTSFFHNDTKIAKIGDNKLSFGNINIDVVKFEKKSEYSYKIIAKSKLQNIKLETIAVDDLPKKEKQRLIELRRQAGIRFVALARWTWKHDKMDKEQESTAYCFKL